MPQPRRRRTAVIVVTVLLLGAAAAIGAAVFGFVGMANRPDSRVGSSSTAATTTTAPATAPPTSVTSMAAAMREWESRAGDHFKESAQALSQISEAGDAGDAAVVRAACQRLHDNNSVGLQADLPTPDPQLTAQLQRMIDDMNTATHACLRFADSRQPHDASTYRDHLSRAVEHLHRAKVILDADLGKG